MKKLIRKLGRLGFILLFSTQCYTIRPSVYNFEGNIGEEKIKFQKRGYPLVEDDNILTITKPNGAIVRYVDNKECDLKLDYIEIINSGKTNKYTLDDEVGKAVIKEAQKKFDLYLKEIKTRKIEDALNNLK